MLMKSSAKKMLSTKTFNFEILQYIVDTNDKKMFCIY
jgi:hypothetical protein